MALTTISFAILTIIATSLLVLIHVAATVVICDRRRPDKMSEPRPRRGCPASQLSARFRGFDSQKTSGTCLPTVNGKPNDSAKEKTKLL